jgi:hypothetical protein
MACYGDCFTFLYVDDVRTSQETCIYASMVCYGNNFTSRYVDDVGTSQETYIYIYIYIHTPPRPVMVIALLFYI